MVEIPGPGWFRKSKSATFPVNTLAPIVPDGVISIAGIIRISVFGPAGVITAEVLA